MGDSQSACIGFVLSHEIDERDSENGRCVGAYVESNPMTVFFRQIVVNFFSNCMYKQALEQLNMFGGTDISELFHKRHENKLEMFNLKSTTEFGKLHELFWWNDPTCIVGGITAQERHICVQNKMRGTQYHLTVCEEDSIYVIQAKFFAAYPESSNANIVWRKAVSTVSL